MEDLEEASNELMLADEEEVGPSQVPRQPLSRLPSASRDCHLLRMAVCAQARQETSLVVCPVQVRYSVGDCFYHASPDEAEEKLQEGELVNPHQRFPKPDQHLCITASWQVGLGLMSHVQLLHCVSSQGVCQSVTCIQLLTVICACQCCGKWGSWLQGVQKADLFECPVQHHRRHRRALAPWKKSLKA